MSENTIENATGGSQELRIGNIVIDLYPIRLRDWIEASKLLYILNWDSLADVAYVGGLDILKDLVRVAARASEKSDNSNLEALESMTDKDFKWLKQIMSAQNDIDMERLLDKVSKISGKPKNV